MPLEIRHGEIAHELMADLEEKGPVDFVDNYDGTEKFRTSCRPKIPNLLERFFRYRSWYAGDEVSRRTTEAEVINGCGVYRQRRHQH